jgi:3-phosphoshikimate 1-carboxyvinyltransferase
MALPDLIEIVPLEQPVKAEITVPGSKSITNRALILAALADGEVTLKGALWSEDTQIMVECLKQLGFVVNVAPDPDEVCNRTIMVVGEAGLIPPGGTETEPLDLFVGNAGTAARFLAPFLCLGSGVYRLHGVPRMHERPQAALFQALRELGYRIEAENGNDKLPARIFAGTAGQPPDSMTEFIQRKQIAPVPKQCRVSIAESSQFASALLLSSEVGGWDIEIEGENADESPYVVMTQKLMAAFPKKGGTFPIEPDASSGSYFWGAGWLMHILTRLAVNPRRYADWTGSPVVVKDWPASSWQIDADFPDFLPFPKTISRENQLGDSIMTAIVLAIDRDAAHSLGFKQYYDSIQFTDLGRLRVQECERVVALRTELTKCGAKVVEEVDTLTIYPREPEELRGAEIETYNDHRMAMCFAILGLKVPGIKIKNPACVKKTFPNFFQKLAAPPPHGLGAEIWEIKNGQRTRKLSGDDLFAD